MLCLCFIFHFSVCIMIFERPYYTFTLEPPTYDFKTLSSSIWFTVVTILSAGYGDIIPATPIGRMICTVAAIAGAIMVAIMIALVTTQYIMAEAQVTAIAEIDEM